MYGLLDRDLKYILEELCKHNEIEKVILFGSRAIGNFKKASDIDLAVLGVNVTRKTISSLNDSLNNEYPIPYFFDIISYNDINNEQLKKHIDELGKLIYNRNA